MSKRTITFTRDQIAKVFGNDQRLIRAFEQIVEFIERQGDSTVINGDSFFLTDVSLNDYSAANAATLTNAPVSGNPTKWIGINDNGTIRKIPTW